MIGKHFRILQNGLFDCHAEANDSFALIGVFDACAVYVHYVRVAGVANKAS